MEVIAFVMAVVLPLLAALIWADENAARRMDSSQRGDPDRARRRRSALPTHGQALRRV